MDLSKHWKTIVDTLQDGLLIVDPQGTIVAVNPAAEKLTGYAANELIGHSCRILNCTGCQILEKNPEGRFCSLYVTAAVRAKKCLITNKATQIVNIVKNATVLKDDAGRVIGAVETLSDMSEVVKKQHEIDQLRRTFDLDDHRYGIIGKSKAIGQVLQLIDNVGPTEAPVMVLGPSGAGKELVARAIHAASPRREKPFIKVNCAALNENLLESELFGHAKGAFTGAEKHRIGRFEAAHGGTIFLDEIGDITPSIQVKLLHVLEEKRVERVGDHQPISVDVRIVTATNKDLEALVREERFREDLYFRIAVFPIHVPPLAQRRDDIPLLVAALIEQNALQSGKKVQGITPEAMALLVNYNWPGNVRELRNVITYAFVLCRDNMIASEHLPPRLSGGPSGCPAPEQTEPNPQRDRLVAALAQFGGNRSHAAHHLGVSRVTLWKWMKRHGLAR